MRKHLGFILIALSIVTVVAGSVQAADWRLDKAGSTLEFVSSYENVQVLGTFKEFDVRLTQFDPQNPAGAQLEVTVKIASADMNSQDINDAIKEAEWFDVAHFPQATFVAKNITRTGRGDFVANGKLKIKSVERSLTLPFSWDDNGDGAAMQGKLTLNRGTYHIGTGDWSSGDLIGLEVNVKFKVNLQRARYG